MVHQYKLNGYNIVLDMASGAVHAVDEVAYDIIALYPGHTPAEIVKIITEISRGHRGRCPGVHRGRGGAEGRRQAVLRGQI